MHIVTLFVSATFPPSISAPQVFFGTVGKESNYIASITSSVGFITFALNGTIGSDSLPSNMRSEINSTTLSLLWTPLHRNENFVLYVISYVEVEDTPTAYSLFRPQIQLCDCQNGGECTTDGVLQFDQSYILLQCLCLTGRKKINCC